MDWVTHNERSVKDNRVTESSSARLQEQLTFAYNNTPAVRIRLDQAGLDPKSIDSIEAFRRIPILSKDRLIELQAQDPPFGGHLAVPRDQVSHIFLSPGPLFEPDGADDTLSRTAEEALRKSGFTEGAVVLNALSYHLVPAGLLLDRALTALGCTVLPGGTAGTELQIAMATQLGATGYVGTPSFLLNLLEKAGDAGLPFTYALCTAEPLFPHQAQRLAEAGIEVHNAYATAELGFLALGRGGERNMSLFSQPFVEVVDPESGLEVPPGSPGEVVVTNFSRIYPLIRFGTGDMALLIDPQPGISQQNERSIILVGRSGEAKKVRGMFVHPNQLRFAVAQVVGPTPTQGEVSHDDQGQDHFTVRVVAAAESWSESQATAVADAVQSICRVRVDRVEPIETLAEDAPGMTDVRNSQRNET